ncbi:hypothetical protein AYI68_g7779 [Smittium mucronatum]|uniref:Uncharacterized protein n=1 Tax=Smittium mucronatum TaxID=133383 RepID=A0A1R0GMS2_9FUNG|nr:hypothetical protein AYI68_g7779 [Smittium mucronatum]
MNPYPDPNYKRFDKNKLLNDSGIGQQGFHTNIFRRWDQSDTQKLDLHTIICLSCAKLSFLPVSRWSSSAIAVF